MSGNREMKVAFSHRERKADGVCGSRDKRKWKRHVSESDPMRKEERRGNTVASLGFIDHCNSKSRVEVGDVG